MFKALPFLSEYALFQVWMSVDFVSVNMCFKQEQTETVRGKGKLQWEWMQYVNSGVSLIHQGLGAYSASQFTTTSPHKTTSMSTPPVFPLLHSASLLLGFQLLGEASLSFTYSLVLIVQEKKSTVLWMNWRADRRYSAIAHQVLERCLTSFLWFLLFKQTWIQIKWIK